MCYAVMVNLGMRKPNWQSSLNLSDLQPRSEPTLELHSRAVSSVGVMYRSSGPNTKSNSGGRRILKKKSILCYLQNTVGNFRRDIEDANKKLISVISFWSRVATCVFIDVIVVWSRCDFLTLVRIFEGVFFGWGTSSLTTLLRFQLWWSGNKFENG